MTKKEKNKIIEITNIWFRNCQYYESENMEKALRFEVGRLAALMHICYEFGIDPGINHTDVHHYIMYQKEKENWIQTKKPKQRNKEKEAIDELT